MKIIAEEYQYFANEKPKIKFILQKSTSGQKFSRNRRSKSRDLEQRIAALERRFEDGKSLQKQMGDVVNCLIALAIQLADDFRISTPEIDSAIARLKAKE